MSHSPARPGHDAGTRPLWITVAVLLAVGIVVPLLVWTYDTEEPRLWGFPFFYWFQFLLIPIVSALTYVAFKLSETATARDRVSRGLPRHSADSPAARKEEGR
ncbi:DUF3311 domain-containing protein [Nocardioides mesophilus]|uniref:DUF3311 domain-containing protein n=1 Tax=Nocardioides mesophilus TaxID=433659 RepID=A0A7G9R8L1_9ACTN|nr:DUF3311 domain-containing protein [Nocardioides mesophilus]QNN51936.1 DUF3311 domain-containing protein [Nocardioides mesophilus]